SIGTVVTSREALLAVSVDTDPPIFVSGKVLLNLQHIDIRYSEFVDMTSATDPFNYTVDGVNPTSVTLLADGMSVRINLAGPLAVASHTDVSIQNVTDLAANVISPNPSTKRLDTPFITCGVALQELYFNIGGVAVSDLRNDPDYPNSPDQIRYKGLLE